MDIDTKFEKEINDFCLHNYSIIYSKYMVIYIISKCKRPDMLNSAMFSKCETEYLPAILPVYIFLIGSRHISTIFSERSHRTKDYFSVRLTPDKYLLGLYTDKID